MSLIRSILEYSAVVWDPYLQKDIDHSLEGVQHPAAHVVKQYHRPKHPDCITSVLKDLKLPPLAERSKRQRLVFMYNVATGLILAALTSENFLVPPESKLMRDVMIPFFKHR